MALLLKDYLHLEPSPTNFSSSTVNVPIHRLIEAELAHFHHHKSRSKNALSKLSAMFFTLKHLPFSGDHRNSAKESFLSRKFWKKRPQPQQNYDEALPPVKVRVRDIVRQRSFGDEGVDAMKLSVDSSCSSSSSSCESEFTGAESFSSSIASCDSFGEMTAVAGDGCEEKKCSNSGYTVVVEEEKQLDCESENEQEQLSPVSVMDFPSEKEEDGEEEETATVSNSSSPSFHQTLANIERSKLQLLQKLRRFENFAELNAVNLSHCFEHLDNSCYSSSHVESLDLELDDDLDKMEASREWAMLEELKSSNYLAVGSTEGSFEKLLVDFFIEGIESYDETKYDCYLHSSKKFVSRSNGQAQIEAKLLERARCWIEGDEEDVNGEVSIREMEKNGQWKCFDEEKETVVLDLEEIVFGSLLEELVVDLVSFQDFHY